MTNFDKNKHQLEGSIGDEGGGLILPKKRQKNEDGVFKKPTISLLGLDALAREKRKQRELKEGPSEKKVRKAYEQKEDRSDSRAYEGGRVRVSFGSGNSKSRQYR